MSEGRKIFEGETTKLLLNQWTILTFNLASCIKDFWNIVVLALKRKHFPVYYGYGVGYSQAIQKLCDRNGLKLASHVCYWLILIYNVY